MRSCSRAERRQRARGRQACHTTAGAERFGHPSQLRTNSPINRLFTDNYPPSPAPSSSTSSSASSTMCRRARVTRSRSCTTSCPAGRRSSASSRWRSAWSRRRMCRMWVFGCSCGFPRFTVSQSEFLTDLRQSTVQRPDARAGPARDAAPRAPREARYPGRDEY